jgi:hypothetical protein
MAPAEMVEPVVRVERAAAAVTVRTVRKAPQVAMPDRPGAAAATRAAAEQVGRAALPVPVRLPALMGPTGMVGMLGLPGTVAMAVTGLQARLELTALHPESPAGQVLTEVRVVRAAAVAMGRAAAQPEEIMRTRAPIPRVVLAATVAMALRAAMAATA